jgi:hypothetical protein
MRNLIKKKYILFKKNAVIFIFFWKFSQKNAII